MFVYYYYSAKFRFRFSPEPSFDEKHLKTCERAPHLPDRPEFVVEYPAATNRSSPLIQSNRIESDQIGSRCQGLVVVVRPSVSSSSFAHQTRRVRPRVRDGFKLSQGKRERLNKSDAKLSFALQELCRPVKVCSHATRAQVPQQVAHRVSVRCLARCVVLLPVWEAAAAAAAATLARAAAAANRGSDTNRCCSCWLERAHGGFRLSNDESHSLNNNSSRFKKRQQQQQQEFQARNPLSLVCAEICLTFSAR